MTVIGADAETMDVHQKRALEIRLPEHTPELDEHAARALTDWIREQRKLRKAG
jgi:hypothetical protein